MRWLSAYGSAYCLGFRLVVAVVDLWVVNCLGVYYGWLLACVLVALRVSSFGCGFVVVLCWLWFWWFGWHLVWFRTTVFAGLVFVFGCRLFRVTCFGVSCVRLWLLAGVRWVCCCDLLD